MNEEMREHHFERITDERAREIYDDLCDACEKREDGLREADQLLIRDVAFLEQTKGLLMADIAERGIGCERRNGRQTYWSDNKSLSHLRAVTEQERKLLAELKLTPAGRKAASIEINDEFDEFE